MEHLEADCLLGSPRGQPAERRLGPAANHLAAGPARGSSGTRACWAPCRQVSLARGHDSGNQNLSGWASAADSTLAAAALQPAGGAASGCGTEYRHIAGAGCEHTGGRLQQQVLWDLLGYCMRQAEGMHCLTTLCSKAWLGSSDRHVVWSADTAHVPFVA